MTRIASTLGLASLLTACGPDLVGTFNGDGKDLRVTGNWDGEALEVEGNGSNGEGFLRVENVDAVGRWVQEQSVPGVTLEYTGSGTTTLSLPGEYELDFTWEKRGEDSSGSDFWGRASLPPDFGFVTIEIDVRRQPDSGGDVSGDGHVLACQSGDVCLVNRYLDSALSEFEAARSQCESAGTYLGEDYLCSGGGVCYFSTSTAESWTHSTADTQQACGRHVARGRRAVRASLSGRRHRTQPVRGPQRIVAGDC